TNDLREQIGHRGHRKVIAVSVCRLHDHAVGALRRGRDTKNRESPPAPGPGGNQPALRTPLRPPRPDPPHGQPRSPTHPAGRRAASNGLSYGTLIIFDISFATSRCS